MIIAFEVCLTYCIFRISYPDISSLFKYEITIWTYASIAFLFGIPLLLLTVGKLRRMI